MLKQRSKNSDWIKLYKESLKIVKPERIRELTDVAVERIRAIVKENPSCAYGFSGGKDSMVLAKLVELSGVEILSFCTLFRHDYPAMNEFNRDTAPKRTVFIVSEDYSIDFLNVHPEYLFPEPYDKKIRAEYTKAWRMTATKYLKEIGIKHLITGRRIEDGNHCGKPMEELRGTYCSHNKDFTSYNVIAEWSHEELLAFIRFYQLPMAPIYNYKDGFVYGTHAWIERDRVDHSIEKTFDELWEIDRSIIYKAASDGLIRAQKYLKERGTR